MTTTKTIPTDTDPLASAQQLQTALCERAASHNPLDERFSFDSSMSDAEIRTKFDAMVAAARKARASEDSANELP